MYRVAAQDVWWVATFLFAGLVTRCDVLKTRGLLVLGKLLVQLEEEINEDTAQKALVLSH